MFKKLRHFWCLFTTGHADSEAISLDIRLNEFKYNRILENTCKTCNKRWVYKIIHTDTCEMKKTIQYRQTPKWN